MFRITLFLIILSTVFIYTSFSLKNKVNTSNPFIEDGTIGYQKWYTSQPSFNIKKVKFEVPFYRLHNAIRRVEM